MSSGSHPRVKLSSLPLTDEQSTTVVFTMKGLVLSCVQQGLTGPFLCKSTVILVLALISINPKSSIKEKLKSGEMHVKGHQWPIFLYADLAYDRDDPWNGLLRNNILVSVRFRFDSLLLMLTAPSGIQICLHFSELRRFRRSNKSYAIWKCPYTWNVFGNTGIYCLHCHPGIFLTGWQL